MKTDRKISSGKRRGAKRPFRTAVFRGMGVVFAPLLTILIFVWVINTTHQYVLDPVIAAIRETLVAATADIVVDSGASEATITVDGQDYRRVAQTKTFVPEVVFTLVEQKPGDPPPETAKAVYRRYVDLTFLRPYFTIPFLLSVLLLVLYLLGKFMAAGIGRFFWHRFEQVINRLPLIRNVYSSVKQVSDFLFTEREIEYTRVVAVEYPRKGIWSLGMVTGESMLDIRSAANEPVLSVLMPTSPMPMTGFTVTVLKSETIDLNITIDQAFQFIISCGVVVPPGQLAEVQAEKTGKMTKHE